MSKKLVAYFSASGVTAKVAETLAEAIGADIFEIEPKVPYTEADLNWMDKNARSTIEMNDPASRPEIAVKRDNMKDYDTIFVVLSVGIAKGGIPLVTVEASPENLCYRLPVQLNEWAMTLVSMANTGEDLFPAEVIFTKAENRIYADIM